VSRVLSGGIAPFSISQETRVKILKAADSLGYRVDPLARAMRGKSNRVIGVIARSFDGVFLPHLTSELARRFRSNGYDIILSAAANDPDEILRLQTLFETQFCDGLVLAADPFGFSETQTQAILNSKHLVMTAWGSPIADIPMVNTDNRLGARWAMEHLLGLGHQRIAFLDIGWSGDAIVRRETYVEMMKQARLDYDRYLLTAVAGMTDGYQATQHLLDLDPRPTAIFAAEDFLAFGALKAAYDRGVSIPRELSIVGFDDHLYAEYSVPALTTVRQPIHAITDYTCELLLRLIREEPVTLSESQVLLPPEFIIRESTAPPNTDL
jgi:LacI family transcriptional regulator